MSRRDGLALLGVLVAALVLRHGALAVPRDRGDQMIWAALACHAAQDGLAGYTIREVDAGFSPVSSDLVLRRFVAGRGRGQVLEGLKRSGESYWDAKIANQPPAFTAILIGSHALLGSPGDGFPLLGRAPRTQWSVESEEALVRETVAAPPEGAVRAQLWATLPVLVSDLLVIVLVFVLARRLGLPLRGAFLAATIYAFDPLALYACHRLLSNTTLALSVVLTAIVWDAACRDRRFLPFAGALAGLAFLVKASAVFLLPAGWKKPLYWVVGLAVLAPWAWLDWKELGNPLGLAWLNVKDYARVSEWGRLVTGRGPLYYFVEVMALSPLLVVGLVAIVDWLRREGTRPFMAIFVLLVLAAAELHTGGKEGRHILLVYPLLAIAAAELLSRARAQLLGLAPFLLLQALIGLGWAYSTARIPP